MRRRQQGQAALEYVIVSAGVFIPLTFMIIFTAQLLWTWHSVVEWTREGARYAVTHCYQNGGENVRGHMRTNVPVNLDQLEFQSGGVTIEIAYFQRDPDTGSLTEFNCSGGDCSTECVPDAVTVGVSGYQFRAFMAYLGLPPVSLPNFQTSLPIESAGCDAELGTCTP
jgi:hypothetical protein